jgi:alpha/beta superfamily hydrolase
MTLPQPTSTFTIPSLHDDLELDCRIYYPRYRHAEQGGEGRHFFGRAFAIVAHPYASLGGSFDDGVVASVGSILLQQGIVLGTFNFRGAGDSPGRVSWTGRAELSDYVSFYGFMLCLATAVSSASHNVDSAKPTSAPAQHSPAKAPLLILGGYSYGSLIASCLPSYEIVHSIFTQTDTGSTEAEIRSRADKAGRDLAAYFAMSRSGSIGRGRSSLRVSDIDSSPKRNVAMGGYDSSEAASRRISRDSSRVSFDGERVRRSLDRVGQRIRAQVSSNEHEVATEVHTPVVESPVGLGFSMREELVKANVVYLLVSPLLGSVSLATTMFSRPTFELRDRHTGRVRIKDTLRQEDKLVDRKTCIVYGTKDVFVAERKARKWAEGLSARSRLVTWSQIEGAGHFWIEKGAMDGLLRVVKAWLPSIADGS